MSIDRLIPTSGVGVTGTAFAEAIQDEVTGLWGNSVVPLTDVAGTGDAITATVAPALTDGLQTGMNFWLEAAADNTGPATIAIGDEVAVDLVDDDGSALGAALLKSGRRYLLAFDGTAMRVYGTSGQKRIADYQVFTASGTWNKPAGTPDDALVIVEVWGAGGGGGTNSGAGGGGGGEYKRAVFRATDLSASETVTIGSGGVAGSVGGNASFGSHVTAYGGGAGGNSSSTMGGGGAGGGGPFAVGGNGNPGGTGNAGTAGVLAGAGGAGSGTSGTAGSTGSDGYFGGAGGGGGWRATAGSASGGGGGRSLFGGGGGGGGGSSAGSGGFSVFGGSGGNAAANGTPPGGGGGGTASGARGEVRVRTIG